MRPRGARPSRRDKASRRRIGRNCGSCGTALTPTGRAALPPSRRTPEPEPLRSSRGSYPPACAIPLFSWTTTASSRIRSRFRPSQRPILGSRIQTGAPRRRSKPGGRWKPPAPGAGSRAPSRSAHSEPDPSAAARAAQAQIRCLVRSGRAETAIRMIQQRFATGTAARGLDLQRRLIAADEQLLALRLMKPSDAQYLPAIRRLAALLNDYRDAPIPSAQRLFLMDELRAAAPGQAVQIGRASCRERV